MRKVLIFIICVNVFLFSKERVSIKKGYGLAKNLRIKQFFKDRSKNCDKLANDFFRRNPENEILEIKETSNRITIIYRENRW